MKLSVSFLGEFNGYSILVKDYKYIKDGKILDYGLEFIIKHLSKSNDFIHINLRSRNDGDEDFMKVINSISLKD